MSLCDAMLSIFQELLKPQSYTYNEVHSNPLPNTTPTLTGYVHNLDHGSAMLITDTGAAYLITADYVDYYQLTMGDRIQAKVSYSPQQDNWTVTEVLEIHKVNYEEMPTSRTDRTITIAFQNIRLGTTAVLTLPENADIQQHLTQILTALPLGTKPIILSFDGRATNFEFKTLPNAVTPTLFLTTPLQKSREKLMQCLLAFFQAQELAAANQDVIIIIDSLDKMFMVYNNCMQKAGLIDPTLLAEAAVIDFEHILCSSKFLTTGGSCTIIGLHQAYDTPPQKFITTRIYQLADTVIK